MVIDSGFVADCSLILIMTLALLAWPPLLGILVVVAVYIQISVKLCAQPSSQNCVNSETRWHSKAVETVHVVQIVHPSKISSV